MDQEDVGMCGRVRQIKTASREQNGNNMDGRRRNKTGIKDKNKINQMVHKNG